MSKAFMKDRFVLSFVLGGALMALTSMRFAVQPLAWIAYAPLLAPLFVEGGRKRLFWLFGVLIVFMHLTVAKIVVAPLSYFFTPLFAVPMALGAFVTIAVSAAAYRRLGVRWGIYLLPALVVTLEWLQYTYTDQSSWGAMALTQTQNLSLMQTGALFGIAGLSYLVALGSSLLAGVLVEGLRRFRWDIAAFVVVFIAAHLYGEVRLAHDAPGTAMRVAAVSSPFSSEETMNVIGDPRLAREKDGLLFSRSARAAELGAKLIAWNEAATIIEKQDEPAFLERGRSLARLKQVDLVMAYGVLVSTKPLQFENKYVWIRSDGSVADEYWKQHPVPGEGSIRGNKAARAVAFPEGKAIGAICYDYDFPKVALTNVRAGAGLAVIPSSDWRGIDPLHSDMARFMGVATGMSILRSVRSATSFASDPYGRVRASMRFYESHEGVMLADVPAIAVPTLYSKTGDILPFITAIFSVISVFVLAVRWLKHRKRRNDLINNALPFMTSAIRLFAAFMVVLGPAFAGSAVAQEVRYYAVPKGAHPHDVAPAPDGYASLTGNHLARIDTKSGKAAVIEPPTRNQGACRVWSDSKGRIWVSEWNSGQVSVYDPKGESWKSWKLPGDSPRAYAVYVDGNDDVWLSDFGANAIARFDPKTEKFTSFPSDRRGANARQILGRPGEVWGAESGNDRLVVIYLKRKP